MADVVEDIKARLDIVDVVSQYVQLKKTGRNFKALCPFHSEKTPSFVVSSEKQICHCFGCNKGGDIFTFIQEVEGVEFSEAIQILADRAGVKIDNVSKFSKQKKSEKDEYFKAHDLACEFFEKQLWKTNDGKKVLEYLKKRGLKDETIKEFRVGFSSDKFAELHPYLLKKGISKNVLLKSGLISAKNITSDEVYDKFRGRLMFPIFDYLGRICGFGGRALKKDQMPKYLNSPENPIYNKSRILYGLYHAKQHVKELDQMILVEGYFDVILPYQEGVKNLAAVSGIALTDYQATLIKRLTPNVVTCFDLDEAGFDATRRAYLTLQQEDIVMKTVSGFEGKDPADLVLDKGGDKFKEFVTKAVDFVEFYIDKLINKNDISVFEGRRVVLNELLPLLKGMSSSKRDFYVRKLATELNTKEQFLYDEMDNVKLAIDHPARQVAEEVHSKGISHEEILFAILLVHPKLFKKFIKRVEENDFEIGMKNIYNGLLGQYNSMRNNFEHWSFDKGFLATIKDKINVLLLFAEERYEDFSEDALALELEKLIDKTKKKRKNQSLAEIQIKIAEAERVKNKKELIELLQKQQKLLSE